MNLVQLETFLEAAEQGSLHRAAEALFLTQPGVGSRLRVLEEELGGPLFERSSTGVHLTDLGRAFFPLAERSVQALRQARGLRHSLHPTATIRMAAGPTVSEHIIPEVLKRFYEDNDGTISEVRVLAGPLLDPVRILLELGFDMVLGVSFRSNPGITAFPLYDDELVVVTPADHPLARKTGLDIPDLTDAPLIFWEPPIAGGTSTEQLLGRAGSALRAYISVNSVDAARSLVRRGLGISIIPKQAFLWDRSVNDGLVMIPFVDDLRPRYPRHVLVRRQRANDPEVKKFLTLLHEVVEQKVRASQ